VVGRAHEWALRQGITTGSMASKAAVRDGRAPR
jgi:hypothetical protein